jgi:hypothetical protein
MAATENRVNCYLPRELKAEFLEVADGDRNLTLSGLLRRAVISELRARGRRP